MTRPLSPDDLGRLSQAFENSNARASVARRRPALRLWLALAAGLLVGWMLARTVLITACSVDAMIGSGAAAYAEGLR